MTVAQEVEAGQPRVDVEPGDAQCVVVVPQGGGFLGVPVGEPGSREARTVGAGDGVPGVGVAVALGFGVSAVQVHHGRHTVLRDGVVGVLKGPVDRGVHRQQVAEGQVVGPVHMDRMVLESHKGRAGIAHGHPGVASSPVLPEAPDGGGEPQSTAEHVLEDRARPQGPGAARCHVDARRPRQRVREARDGMRIGDRVEVQRVRDRRKRLPRGGLGRRGRVEAPKERGAPHGRTGLDEASSVHCSPLSEVRDHWTHITRNWVKRIALCAD